MSASVKGGTGRSVIIHNARLIDSGTDERGALLVRDGLIAGICLGEDGPDSLFHMSDESPDLFDARGLVLMPSFIDMHAHFRDPGHTTKEDLVSASRAAAAGGYGTVVLMPNTNPVISDAESALAVRERVQSAGLIDAFQSVSLTRGFDGTDTSALENLDPASVPVATEDGKEVSSAAVMLKAMELCARQGVLVSCHCEDPDLAVAARPFREQALSVAGGDPACRRDLAARFTSLSGSADFEPVRANLAQAGRLLRLAENTMTERNLALAAAAACRVHIAHISTREALDAVRRYRAERPNGVSCEVTPHHLALNDLVPGIVNPPLRSEADRLALVDALADGTIDAIATDHAPHTAADKAAGAPGFSGIQTAFSLCHTVLVKNGRISLQRLSALMSGRPAELLALARGRLRVGFAADLVLVDPVLAWKVNAADSSAWYSRSRNSPVDGETLHGRVVHTWKAGRTVWSLQQGFTV